MNKKTEILIDLLDESTRDNFVRLQQKLKGLKAEVGVKLEAIAGSKTNTEARDSEEYEQHLQQLAHEVDMAVQRIDAIMYMPITDDVAESVYNNIPMDELSRKIEERVKEISRLKEQF